MSADQVKFDLVVDATQTLTQIRQLESVLNRVLSLTRRMGLPEEYEQLVSKIQALITLLNQYRMTVMQAQLASGPLGWIMLGVGVVGTVYGTAEFMEYELRGH